MVTASEGVIGGPQQFGQRPSAGGDAGVGELVEQRRRWRRRRARDSDVGLPGVIGVKAFDERSGCLFGAVGGRRSFGAGGGQVGQQLLAVAAAPRQDGERVVVEGLGEQVEGGGKVLDVESVDSFATVANPMGVAGQYTLPMPILHIEHQIVDLGTWLRDFASRAPAREQAGVTEVHVLQAEDDPQDIVELLFFDTADAANNYRMFMREQVWSSTSPGLASDPHGLIFHEVETGSKA